MDIDPTTATISHADEPVCEVIVLRAATDGRTNERKTIGIRQNLAET